MHISVCLVQDHSLKGPKLFFQQNQLTNYAVSANHRQMPGELKQQKVLRDR